MPLASSINKAKFDQKVRLGRSLIERREPHSFGSRQSSEFRVYSSLTRQTDRDSPISRSLASNFWQSPKGGAGWQVRGVESRGLAESQHIAQASRLHGRRRRGVSGTGR
eukprot:scaffold24670_cov67-Phaeocystis_antarctica.AAC.3